MNDLLTIQLKHLRFFARHGIHEEERVTGADFEINLLLTYSPGGNVPSDISNTIDYVKVHDLVRREMNLPTALLETLAMKIVNLLKEEFTQIRSAEIEITKLHPPIAAFTGNVGVKYRKEF